MATRAGLDYKKVVQAAAELADKDGLHQLSMATLAAHLRIRPPTLYPTTRPSDFDEHFNKVKAMLREPGRLRAMRHIFSDNGQEADARVEQVQVPVLVVMGSRDPDFKQPEQEAHTFAARFHATQAKVAIIEGAGHHPQAEMPEQTAACFLEFLAAQVAPREANRR